jgi:V8-like Glu-specific endopeptidase
MHKRSLPVLFTVLLTILFSLFFVALPANAAYHATSPVQQANHIIGSGRMTGDPSKVNAYWTPARMKAAIPADILAKGKVTPAIPDKGSSGHEAPVMPIKLYANKVKHSKYSQFPYSTVGKIFFTDPATGLNYVCSGAAVNSNNLNVVDTAGHCVVAGGSGANGNTPDWYTNWEFCPQYFNGNSPYGCWVYKQLWSWSEWVDNNSSEDDIGDVAVYANGYGNLVNVVGGTGWVYGGSATVTFSALGYPAASPFNGNLMYLCKGIGTSHSYDDGSVVEMSCNMTGGCSGGPWMITYNNTFGYVNGHNDFRYNNPNQLYSPYYDSDWYATFNAAQNS